MSQLPRIHLFANVRSGKGLGGEVVALAKTIAASRGLELVHHHSRGPADFETTAEGAARAAQEDGGTLVAAGGDGTIRSLAQKAVAFGVPFGVVACGTFNYFARTHRIPEDLEGALAIAMSGEIRPVRLGEVNGQLFLINASLGLYAKSIRQREKSTKRFGRDRLVVILSTMKTLLGFHRHLDVELLSGKDSMRVKTSTIFIGNNALQLRDLSMDVARCMKKDLLAAVVLKRVTRLEMLRIFWRGVSKTLERDERLESFCVDSLQIKLRRRRTLVALDGELFVMKSPLVVTARPNILRMRLPPREEPS